MDAKKEDYRNRWEREHRSRIVVITEPSIKEEIRLAADQAGQSINAYILQAVQDSMEGR